MAAAADAGGASNRRKLIEVALPLDAINAASRREKSIRHGHPSTLHLWWARRPLAAARAVIFSQMVDDPSEDPERFPTEESRTRERARLFRLIEELVTWENTTNRTVLERARREILRSWRRTCSENRDHPNAAKLFDPKRLPAFHDPFAGGGALPLEAQRLGLEAHASDLNPVAVLINKAMIEIPPRFADRRPVHTTGAVGASTPRATLIDREWKGAQGLAEDVRHYGGWMRKEADKRIGDLYPSVAVTSRMARRRRDLKKYEGRRLTVIAWLWARTVPSPNPAFSDVEVPLASSFMLSTKKGKEAYVEPVIEDGGYRFDVRVGPPMDRDAAKRGTKMSRGANFRCLMSGAPLAPDYVKSEGRAGRMGARLMAIVAEGDRERVYLSPSAEQADAARRAQPEWRPELAQPENPRWFSPPDYGLPTFGDLFTSRQLVALTTFSDLVGEAMEQVQRDAVAAGVSDDDRPLRDGGTGARAYAEAVGVYLAFAVDKGANYWSSLCAWHTGAQKLVSTFGRQALPMVWDYTETNPFSSSSGNALLGVQQAAKMIEKLGIGVPGTGSQADAATRSDGRYKVVSTDPPYYDNIGYADLSDFFYIWLRRSLRPVFPGLFATLAVPKAEELVATPYRHETKERAEEFFLNGMTQAMGRLARQSHSALPVTIYYAFKQAEKRASGASTSTGWETFLAAVIRAGFSVTGTWPMRTEYTGNLKKNVAALASSIVLVCRRRPADAPLATRREFLTALRSELPTALAVMRSGNIAPVDLAQAAIGPGMAVYTRYGRSQSHAGRRLPVRPRCSDEFLSSLPSVAAAGPKRVGVDAGWRSRVRRSYRMGARPSWSPGLRRWSEGRKRLRRVHRASFNGDSVMP
ncbi:MAG: DUF1156 domain-containing protein [Gammaproteobacteria bacterium]|nr:DUF1156 domain-containing protein [Gammaproteobacteria bacterium]